MTRPAGQRSALKRDDWDYISSTRLDEMSEDDWLLLNRQRAQYLPEEKPQQALVMLAAQRDAPSFGYQINNYEHCLQSATKALHDGRDADTVVVALFHDLGFAVCNESHGDFAAELLRPYVDDRHIWTLQRHMYFQAVHCPNAPGAEPSVIERWRGHDYFDWAEEFVRCYDIDAIDPDFINAPLEAFLPFVQEVFQRPPKSTLPD